MEIKEHQGFSRDPLLGTPQVPEVLKQVNGTIVTRTTDRPVFEQTPFDYSVNSILDSNGDPSQGSTFESQPTLNDTDKIMSQVAKTNFKLDNKQSKESDK